MITPSHIIYSWVLVKKTEDKDLGNTPKALQRRTCTFVLGALLPHTSNYLYIKYSGKWTILIITLGILYSALLIVEPIMNTLYGS